MSVLLVAEKIEKRYRDRVVLRAEWIAVNAGDAIILSGPNGGGKSTLMRILIGVTAPSAGRLERTREMKALRLVYVPQEGGLYQNLTLLENYQLWSRLYGEPASASSNFFSLLEFLGLEPFLRLRVSELSGGYRKIAA